MRMKLYLQTRPKLQIRTIPLKTDTLLVNLYLDVSIPTFPATDSIFASSHDQTLQVLSSNFFLKISCSTWGG